MTPRDLPLFDRREALRMIAIGGALGSLASLGGCRTPQVYRERPSGEPTGYLVDTSICTRCGDCFKVCPCKAVVGHPREAEQCWIDLAKCCACGECYRVCDVDAIVPCYGLAKTPARDLPPFSPGHFGYNVSPGAAPSTHRH